MPVKNLLNAEVYIKKMLLYYGRKLFGKSVDNLSLLTQTVLGIMFVCLNASPKSISK